jgi:hypothetical protein
MPWFIFLILPLILCGFVLNFNLKFREAVLKYHTAIVIFSDLWQEEIIRVLAVQHILTKIRVTLAIENVGTLNYL